jgi:hypothetical protein
MPCAIHTWTAIASTSDSGRKLAVVGKGECTRAGYKLSLQPGNKGIDPNPKEYVLELSITAPQGGVDVSIATSVQFESKVGSEVTFVTIRAPGGNQRVDIREV